MSRFRASNGGLAVCAFDDRLKKLDRKLELKKNQRTGKREIRRKRPDGGSSLITTLKDEQGNPREPGEKDLDNLRKHDTWNLDVLGAVEKEEYDRNRADEREQEAWNKETIHEMTHVFRDRKSFDMGGPRGAQREVALTPNRMVVRIGAHLENGKLVRH